jgi:4-hydroxybenzoate polyprenyltransferase
MVLVVARHNPITWQQIVAILFAVVSARTAAMGFNRIIDRHIDAKNPRTAMRELPRGALTLGQAWTMTIAASLVFLASSALLRFECLLLAPLVLALLFFYSAMKRFAHGAHLVLGLALACAPGGVWFALTGTVAWLPVLMMAGVLFWVAGFDILYSCQDHDFDKKEGLYSIPAQIGIAPAFWVARIFHLVAVVFLWWFGIAADLKAAYFCGIALFAGLLLSQHLIISPRDLSRIDAAFFTRNGLGSIVYFAGVVAPLITMIRYPYRWEKSGLVDCEWLAGARGCQDFLCTSLKESAFVCNSFGLLQATPVE